MKKSAYRLIENREDLVLPEEEYSCIIPGGNGDTEFLIRPVSQKCQELLGNALDEGAKILLMPNKNPECISVRYESKVRAIPNFNYEVVGLELNLTLHLVGGLDEDFESRITKFLYDIIISKTNHLPVHSNKKEVKFVQVIQTHKY